jgi:hypothetical protein
MREIDFEERENRRAELERFKRDIDLRQFAMSIGYVQVQHSGRYWRGRRADKDEIVVTRTADGVWVYANPRDVSRSKTALSAGERPGDQGTVIDLLQRERPELVRKLGAVRQELRRWTGVCPTPSVPPLATPRRVARAELLADVMRADRSGRSAYLGERGLRSETLTDPRFIGSFGVRPWGEVIFPHRDEQGISGYERKHTSFTSFSTGGTRALWHSNLRADDRRLVFAEAAIDCLSFHQLNPRDDARYMSTAGTISGGGHRKARRFGRARRGHETAKRKPPVERHR